MSLRHFPLFLDLHEVPVLVVGGGVVAQRKLELLDQAGARLTVVAPQICDAIREAATTRGWTLRQETFRPEFVKQQRLVIAATDDAQVNAEVATAARAAGIWINAVDQPECGDAIVPAMLSRGPLTIAIGSDGSAPVLARRLRAQIESQLDPSLGALAQLLADWRGRIRAAVPDLSQRRALYDAMLDGEIPTLLRVGQKAAAEAALARALTEAAPTPAGRVVLVGAGPGDPGLLTLAALRHLQRADVIVHDQLVSPEVLELARRDAERIEVGKRGGGHSVSQLSINTILVALAQAGRYVVRLKGGDPLTFARGGEELAVLRQHGVAYEIVPGISAAQGCAAYAGIPLTHRDHAQSVRLVTAHCQGSIDRLDWRALAQGGETLVFYMGVAQASEIQLRLREHGLVGDTPFAAIENGTRANQRVIDGRLDQLVTTLHQHQVKAPALLIIGAVTAPELRSAWFGEARQSNPDPTATPTAERTAALSAAL